MTRLGERLIRAAKEGIEIARTCDRAELTARAVVRTLRACGDDEEKQIRFLTKVLRDWS